MNEKSPPKYININTIETTKVYGYQVRIMNFTPFFGGITPQSLRDALKTRNEFYEENSYIPPGIGRRHMKPCVPDIGCTTGWHGLSFTIANEASGPLIISCTARHLQTGKPHTISVRVHLHQSDKKAMAFAVKARNHNVDQYNKLVTAYNEIVLPTTLKYARREARTFEPCMHELKGFNEKIWNKCIKMIYPLGLISSVEARTKK